MIDQSDLSTNVVYALTHIRVFNSIPTRSLARMLDVDTSTISRWLSGSTAPRENQLVKLATKSGIEKHSFYLPHDEFVAQIAAANVLVDYSTVEPHVIFGSIEKWRHLWTECARKHAGTYILYTRVLTNAQLVAKSLVHVHEATQAGINFEIFNVDTRNTPAKPTVYRYRGLMFPVYDCLFFYCEEGSKNELLSMTTTSSQVDVPALLTGYLVAVGVTPELRKPTGTRLVLAFHSRKQVELAIMMTKLGITESNKIDERIRELLFAP